jgi:beta-lactamase class A
MNKKIIFKILNILIIIIFGFIIGYFINQKNIDKLSNQIKEKEKIHEEDLGSEIREEAFYEFINPLLDCEVSKGTIDSKKQNFDKELQVFIKKEIDESGLSDMAIYFRDLNNGPTFGIKEDELFIPASLFKLPVMMIYFHIAETKPEVLQKEIIFDKSVNSGNIKQLIKPSKEIEVGHKYSVEELIEAAIKYSDNQALNLLNKNLVDSGFDQEVTDFFNFFGIDYLSISNLKESVSVKQYSRFFRILFNSSFLNRDDSEKALRILSEAEYKNALVAGIPKGIVVAHKFGEAGFNGGELQLHDCGIVYYPKHPYLICAMSRGKNLSDLEKAISDVSRFVYEKIAEQY